MRNNTRPEDILETAAELFFLHGFAHTKMIDIARGTGISKGLLYFYYKNKEDLFLAVLDHALQLNLDLLDQTLNEMRGASGLNRSLTLLDRFLQLSIRTRHFQEIIIHSMQLADGSNLPDIAKKLGVTERVFEHERIPEIRDRQFRIYERVRDCIREGQNDGSIPNAAPPSVIYLSIWSFIIGFDTMLPVMENHRTSTIEPKHDYLLTPPDLWRIMILQTARGILLSG